MQMSLIGQGRTALCPRIILLSQIGVSERDVKTCIFEGVLQHAHTYMHTHTHTHTHHNPHTPHTQQHTPHTPHTLQSTHINKGTQVPHFTLLTYKDSLCLSHRHTHTHTHAHTHSHTQTLTYLCLLHTHTHTDTHTHTLTLTHRSAEPRVITE